MPRHHRRSHRSHDRSRTQESADGTQPPDRQFQSLQEATASLFEITSAISGHLNRLDQAFRDLATVTADYLPGDFQTRIQAILQTHADLMQDLPQGPTERLDPVEERDDLKPS